MNGFIALHRKITDNPLYFSERFTRMQAWIDLLLLVSYKKQYVFVRGNKVELNPGQLCCSKSGLARRWKWSRQTVDNYIKLLENENMIASKSTKLTTVITILKWSEYQFTLQQTGSRTYNHYNNNKDNKEEVISLNNLPPGCV